MAYDALTLEFIITLPEKLKIFAQRKRFFLQCTDDEGKIMPGSFDFNILKMIFNAAHDEDELIALIHSPPRCEESDRLSGEIWDAWRKYKGNRPTA